MLKVDFMSDLHLEFASDELDLGTGDVLVLAGDILTARNLNVDPSSPKRQKYTAFMDKASKHYTNVVYVAGNHEHYGHAIEKTLRDVKAWAPSNVHFLEREEFVLGDWVFLGTTLWTDLKDNDPLVSWDLARYMNDFRAISINHSKFTTHKWWAEHFISSRWLGEKLAEHADKKVFVVTHHAPSFQSISDYYRTERNKNVNHGYFTDLEEFILVHPQIKYWVHGHTHNSADYMIGGTRVLCNPRGYPKTDDENPDFKLDFGLKLD